MSISFAENVCFVTISPAAAADACTVPQVFTVPSAPATTFAPLLPASSSVPYAQPPTSTSDSMPTTGPQQPSQGPAPSAAGDPITDPGKE